MTTVLLLIAALFLFLAALKLGDALRAIAFEIERRGGFNWQALGDFITSAASDCEPTRSIDPRRCGGNPGQRPKRR